MSDHAHSSECEEADVGSLCDCDCAGAKHAVRRTKGGVPGAGQVSQRAQKAAHAAGRAPVVNNRAEPSGRGRRSPTKPDTPPDVPPGKTPPGKTPPDVPPGKVKPGKRIPPKPDLPKLDPPKPPEPEPAKAKTPRARKPKDGVATGGRTATLAPTTLAKAKAVRDALPKTREQWHEVAASEAGDEETRKLAEQLVADAQAKVDKHNTDIEALYEKVAQNILKDWKESGNLTGMYRGDTAKALADARAIAPHRAWGGALNNAYDKLTAKRSNAQSLLFGAERALKQFGVNQYPRDKATGLPMPSKQLTAHLESVKSVGRAALDDAKRQWDRDQSPEVAQAKDLLGKVAPIDKAVNDLGKIMYLAYRGAEPEFTHPDGTVEKVSKDRMVDLQVQYQTQQREMAAQARTARSLIAAHQANTIRTMLAEHREFGGASHTDVTAGKDPNGAYGPKAQRRDWRKRLTTAEQHFPTDWIKASAGRPLKVSSSDRAYYSDVTGNLSMPSHKQDKQPMDGALDYVDEVNVHELGHRMEGTIPGLTHLEFAYVRQRATRSDGTVEKIEPMPGYSSEKAQADKWGAAYAGKSYEDRTPERPGDQSWEVFQVGLQDTFGRTSKVYGPTDDPEELQAFVIGAMLTLG